MKLPNREPEVPKITGGHRTVCSARWISSRRLSSIRPHSHHIVVPPFGPSDPNLELGGLLKRCLRSEHAPEPPIGDQPSDEREQCACNNVIPGQHAHSMRMHMWHE